MINSKLLNALSVAQANYSALVSSYTLEDSLNGNAQKDFEVEVALESIDKIKRTLSVRADAAKINRQFS